MIRLWVVLGACLALGAGRCDAVEVGAPAPAFELTARDGAVHSLESLSGGAPLLLDFGSVFCIACREVLEWLEGVQQRYGPRGLRVAAVNLDGPRFLTAVNSVCDNLGATYPVLLDADGSVAEAYGVEAIPYLVVVDPSGTVRAVHLGRAPNLATALELETLLTERETKR